MSPAPTLSTSTRRRQLSAAHAADVPRARRRRLSRAPRRRPRQPALHLRRALRARPAARLGAGGARHRPRRHRLGHAAEHAADARGPLRRADDRRACCTRSTPGSTPAIIAFQLDHAESKVVICDREFAAVMREALAQAKVKPLVIDYDDTEFPQAGEPLSAIDYEAFLAEGDPGFRWRMPRGRVGGDRAQLHLAAPPATPRAWSTTTAAPPSCATPTCWRPTSASTPSTCGRCRCSTATAGASPGRSPPWPARTCACAGCGRRPSSTPSPSTR